MAITIISPDQNLWEGQFETDRSTWLGWTDYLDRILFTRDSSQKYSGNFACKVSLSDAFISTEQRRFINVRASHSHQTNTAESYMIQFYIRNDPSNPAINSNAVLDITTTLGSSIILNPSWEFDFSNLNNWTRVRFFYEASSGVRQLSFGIADEYLSRPGAFFIDKIEQFRIQTEEESCKLKFDSFNTIVVDETDSLANGSVTIAITNPDGVTPEYRIRAGASPITPWQDSNLFSGLSGNQSVFIEVRDKNDPTCFDSGNVYINNTSTALDFSWEVTHESTVGAEDGRIVVTPINGTAPFEYSVDGGATYQASNSFENLAPNIYIVVVRDSLAEQVGKIIPVNPAVITFSKLFLSKNPIIENRSGSANSSNPNYRIHADLKVEIEVGSGVFQSVMKAEQELDESGQTTFNFRSGFRGVFNPSPPSQNESQFKRLLDRSILAKVDYGELYNELVDPVNITAGSPFLVVLGGLNKLKFPTTPFYRDVGTTRALIRNSGTMFLTWAPNHRVMDRDQENYVNFITPDSGFLGISLQADIQYTDGTSLNFQELQPQTPAPEGQITQIPIGPANSGVLDVDPTKTVDHYFIYVVDGVTPSSQKIRVDVNQNKPKYVRYYLFLNSLGSYEVIRCTGKATDTAKISKTKFRKHLPAQYDPLDGEIEVFNTKKDLSSKISSGFMINKETLEWFQDFAMSEKVFDITDGNRTPVTIEAGSFPINRDGDYTYFARFTATSTYEEEVFTPKQIV